MELGNKVTLLVPDLPLGGTVSKHKNLTLMQHTGFEDYQQKCLGLALTHDAALMTAAVVNWIPAEPVIGKMATKGYKEGSVIDVPFYLAPRVINRMRKSNPKLTLVGCKMLSGSSRDHLVEEAYHGVLLAAGCNAVVANDLQDLRTKLLVYPDKTVFEFRQEKTKPSFAPDFLHLYQHISDLIQDTFYRTQWTCLTIFETSPLVDQVMDKYRDRFSPRGDGSVFGSLFVPDRNPPRGGWCSPREKKSSFGSFDAPYIRSVEGTLVRVVGPNKATLNAPLLRRVSERYPDASAILHLHEQLPGVPTLPYAPPGTVRDNDREFSTPCFNIQGHGFVACLDESLNIIKG